MRNVLVINSSAGREQSVSRTLVDYAVQRLVAIYPGLKVTSRDLDADPVPHLLSSTVAGVRGLAASEDELDAQALSDRIIAEVQAADFLLVGAPMYNFGIPTTLRSWFDHLLRPRIAFSYTEVGPQGLLTGKSAMIIEARGGLYSEGPAQTLDFQEPYLKHLLAFVGITEVMFIRAEKIGFGSDARELAIEAAKERIAAALPRIGSIVASPGRVPRGGSQIAGTIG